MIKKIITSIVLIIMAFTTLVGCNKSYGFGNYNFKNIHVDMHNYSGCLTVEKWYDNETGIEVKTKEAGFLYLAEGMYVLVEDDCPFCNN